MWSFADGDYYSEVTGWTMVGLSWQFSLRLYSGWAWSQRVGYKMINKVANTFQVSRRVECLANCTVSSICDSYNYRRSDKTCELNTHDTPLIANSVDIVADSAWGWWLHSSCLSSQWIHYVYMMIFKTSMHVCSSLLCCVSVELYFYFNAEWKGHFVYSLTRIQSNVAP